MVWFLHVMMCVAAHHSLFFSKSLRSGTNTCSVTDNEPNGDGMWFPLDWNVRPYQGHKAQFSAGPQWQKHAFLKSTRWGVLCEPFIILLSHVCLLAGTRPNFSKWLHSLCLLLMTVITLEALVWWLIQWCNNLAKWVNYISSPAHARICAFFSSPQVPPTTTMCDL